MIDTTTMRRAPTPEVLRVRNLRQRFGLSEPTARLLAGLAYGEVRQ